MTQSRPAGDSLAAQSATDAGAATPEPDIRPLMTRFPSGVSVITALDDEGLPRGLTCSSLASVALSPPTVVVCLRSASPSLVAVLDSGQFVLNLLHEDAQATSDLFASGATDRFERVEWRLPLGAGGPHLVNDSIAIADCRVVRTLEVGDHTAVFGEVQRLAVEEGAEPLLYGLRRYGRWSDTAPRPVSTVAGAPAPSGPSTS
ncbi:flavin reductase (DIM6/NTAB) family NADH-FMN oxidoreductase RutF [Streptacidiphilus sp. MAP12-33]|uniref:flavin reductase family protein n=1 Tax=Streptacidiphilus sp. MAP12-33 TaxID=3156266 RepID=UPI0035187E35